MTRQHFQRYRTRLCSVTLLVMTALSSASFAMTATVEHVKSIARLYSAAFDREPKVGGLNFWVDSYEGGRSVVFIADNFYGSPEFTAKYGPLDDRQYVEQLFRNVLGRDGAEGGITFQVGNLASGATQGSFFDRTDADSYTLSLAGTTHFEGQSRFSPQGFFILLYDNRKPLLASSDVAFQRDLNPAEYTVVVSLCDQDGFCYQGVENYTVIIN